IASRSHLNAPRSATEVGRVEIKLEDFVLGEHPLQRGGNNHLPYLALVGNLLADQQVLHHLLRYCRTALRSARLCQVPDKSANQRAFIDAIVLIEALVFSCDKGLL